MAAPPDKGELRSAIVALAARSWQHPSTGEPVRFGFSTIERWYYRALRERADPVGSLRRKLHHDNLVALALTRPELQPVPSYATLRRFMRANGLDKRRRLTPRTTDGAERAEARLVEREVRRYEAEYVNGLWHWDSCPDSDALRLAFTRSAHRTQKKSDGSIVIEGRRFEVPNRYRHLARIEVRYASWDLSAVHLVDERTGNVLARL